MADQAEIAFLRTLSNTLSAQPVVYGDNYQQPPENWLPKVPVIKIPVPAPPSRPSASSSAASSSQGTSGEITLTIKSIKPSLTHTLSLHPADTVLSLKQRLSELSGWPAVAAQRLLLKGKALADARLLGEYSLKSGDVVTLMISKDAVVIAAAAPPAPTSEPAPAVVKPSGSTLSIETDAQPSKSRKQQSGHGRTPSIVLSPSPSPSLELPPPPELLLHDSGAGAVKDIHLTLDAVPPPAGEAAHAMPEFHDTIARPEFWEALLSFLQEQSQQSPATATDIYELFLRAAKGGLTASEIARIRDRVGVVGMGGL